MTATTSNTYEHTDKFGITYRLTVDLPHADFLKSDRGYMDQATYAGGVWEAALAVHAALFPEGSRSLASALAEHEWHGSAFEEYFYPSTEVIGQ